MMLLALFLSTLVCGCTATAAPCDEWTLERDASVLLAAHVDVELGGVGAGAPDVVGFQYLKPAEALLAAQAIAHGDFNQAAAQVQHILRYMRPDGLLPHLVYGPSVPSELFWIPSNRTFYPGPAFWQPIPPQQQDKTPAPHLNISTVSAPPVAADVVWEIFRLAPYDSGVGVRTIAVQFLCSVYEPLKKLQRHLFSTRRGAAPIGLLAAHHPWETFSSLSPHWEDFLVRLKVARDYRTVINKIPQSARDRFALGAQSILTSEEAISNFYEPMIYLAAKLHRGRGGKDVYSRDSAVLAAKDADSAQFWVEDVEFNSLMLRSSLGLVNIGCVLVEHSSVCTDFSLTEKELVDDVKELRSIARGLQTALIGSNTTRGLWNATSDFFSDSSLPSLTAVPSLREFLPSYAAALSDDQRMRSMKHFLTEPDTFSFFCTQFPASFFPCSTSSKNTQPVTATWTLYNYFLLRGFSRNKFPGLAEYIRNKTRDMVCGATPHEITLPSWLFTAEKPGQTALALAYNSRNATALDVFDDTYMDSPLAAATILNILLPAATPPPSPDTPPIDHRILSVIMCVELVVAFGVAMSCFLFSVYFVANRPREGRPSPASAGRYQSSGIRRKEELEDRGRSSVGSSLADRYSESSYSDYSPRSGRTPYELEESLISEEDEHYGSFGEGQRKQSPSNAAWKTAKDVLASISPW